MRVAIVRQRYNPYGGAERFIERALPALERAGAEVTLIARSWEDGNAGWGSGRVLPVDPFHIGSVWRDWSFASAARSAWRAGGFDLVQSHERIAGCDIYRAGDGVHRRWLEIRRAAAGPLERLGIALNPYHRYVCAAERSMFEHPALRAVICNSNMVREDILRAFRVAPEKLHVIHNGVDLEHFHPRERAARRAAARAELGVAAGEFVFLFVGSGFARKGLVTVLRALARLPQLRLVVAGQDRNARRYGASAARLGVAGRVRLLGGVQDVRPLYAAADCFILPSLYDPFPNAALESLAMGVPVIVSRSCGAAELVREGENGWLCEANDPISLATLMRGASQIAQGKRMRAAARASAERFGLEAMSAALLGLYRSLLGQ